MFAKQISVMRGQCYNLIEILRKNATPSELVERPLVTFIEEPSSSDDSLREKTNRTFTKVKQNLTKLVKSRAFFTSC